jgi:excisionase family DNA binding protein
MKEKTVYFGLGRFLDLKHAALILGCDRRTVKKAVERGELPAVRFGRTYRIPIDYLFPNPKPIEEP